MHFKLNIHLRFYDLWPFSGERQRRSGACMPTRNSITSIHGKNKIKGSLWLINSIRTHKSWCGNQYGALKSELFIDSWNLMEMELMLIIPLNFSFKSCFCNFFFFFFSFGLICGVFFLKKKNSYTLIFLNEHPSCYKSYN